MNTPLKFIGHRNGHNVYILERKDGHEIELAVIDTANVVYDKKVGKLFMYHADGSLPIIDRRRI